MKKTSNKATKRRLKKSIRRTFGGLFLASAILVAAIPFPEARAYDPEVAAIPEYPTDLYNPDNTDITNTDYSAKPASEIHEALGVYSDSSGGWNMDWQYKYWGETPSSDGYITEYNSGYSQNDIYLGHYAYSDYAYITQDDMANFETSNGTVSVTIHRGEQVPLPTDNRTINGYLYEYKMESAFDSTNQDHVWLMRNYPDLVEVYSQTLADGGTPSPIIKTMADLFQNKDEKLAEFCKQVFGDSVPENFKLVPVNTVTDSGFGTVYIPNAGAKTADGTLELLGHSYKIDDNNFLCDNHAKIVGIGREAFKGVSNVGNITLAPEITFIGDRAFEESSIATISLPSGTKIGNRAFYRCGSLSSVELKEGISTIPVEAFYGCPLGAGTLIIPDSCTTIGDGAFAESGMLASVSFTSSGSTSPKTIGDFAFYNDLKLSNVTFDSSSHITKIGDAAFALSYYDESGLTEFLYPAFIEKESDGTTSIGEYCLAGRSQLKYVTFPNNTKGKLNDTIFFGCSGLETVTFGEGCIDVSYNSDGSDENTMFYTVTNKNFYVRGPKNNNAGKPSAPRTSTWKARYDYANKSKEVPYVYVDDGKEFYEVAQGNYLLLIDKETGELVSCSLASEPSADDDGTLVIPDSVGTTTVTGIKDGCFDVEMLNYIVHLVIQDGSQIEVLHDNTFKGANNLETVYIGDSVKYLGAGVFEDCPKLVEATISKNINEIGEKAFQNCPSLEDITFERPNNYESFTTIGSNAFNTYGNSLTIHGDLVKDYAPFAWAVDPDNYANKKDSIRVLYKSLLPQSIKDESSGLSVILDNQNGLVTLVDYPHYEYLNRIVFDDETERLVELKDAPVAGEPLYDKTIKYKIDNGDNLNDLEQKMINICSVINLPEGVQSIDAKGFFNDSSMLIDGVTPYSNKASVSAYFPNMALSPFNSYAKYGLFNGFYGDEVGLDGTRDYPQGDSKEKKDQGNDRLEEIHMYDLVYLPDHAFESCENLIDAYVGGDLLDVGSIPFVGCRNLSSVGFGTDEYFCNDGIIYKRNDNGTKTVVEGLGKLGINPGQPTLNVSNYPSLSDVTEIMEGAFTDCDGIAKVNFADMPYLEIVPAECFKDCDNLSEVDFPINITDIGDRAFEGAGDYIKVTVRNRNLYLGADTNGPVGNKIGNAFYITYKDAQSIRTAKNQGYIIDEYLDDKWVVTYFDQDGKNVLGTELVDDGKDAVGLDPELIPEIPGYKFVRWNPTLENITEDSKVYAVYEKDDSIPITPTPEVTPEITPVPTQGGVTPIVTPTSQANPITPDVTPNVITPQVTTDPDSPTVTPTQSPGDSDEEQDWNDWEDDEEHQDEQNNVKKYKLNVVYGSGSGEYLTNTTIIIQAIDPPAGKVFDKWVVTNGNPWIYSATSKATTIRMPASDCTITATYKDINGDPSKQSVNIGNKYGNTGGGSTNNKRYGTVVDINKPGISNVDKAYASVSGSSDNFIVKILDNNEAANMIATYLAQRYADMSPIKYYAMELALYDGNGVNKISGYDGLAVTVTIPIPDALVAYAGNNRVAAVDGSTLIDIPCKFVTVDGIPCVSFTATKFGIPYTIYADTSNLTYGTIDSTPKTGDGIHPKWFVSIALFCCSMILFLKKDKVNKRVRTA